MNEEIREENKKEDKKHKKEIEALNEKIEKLENGNKELEDKYLRLVAEYDNYRKRTAKEKESIYPEAKVSVVSAFLPVLDNLERALASACTDENYKKGVEMIYNSFVETLKGLGVEEIEAVDFNPSFHQAVQQVESDELESGKISAVFQKGYKVKDRVIRYSMVKVSVE